MPTLDPWEDGASPISGRDRYEPMIAEASQKYKVNPDRIRAIIEQESGFNPVAYNKETGATGLGQFIPATAKAYGIDPRDEKQSIDTTARMFKENQDRFGGDEDKATKAHFAGPDTKKWGPKTDQYGKDIEKKMSPQKTTASAGNDPWELDPWEQPKRPAAGDQKPMSLFEQAVTSVLGDSPVAHGVVALEKRLNPFSQAIGLGEAALHLGSGALAYPASLVAGLTARKEDMQGATGPEQIQQDVMRQATYEPRTQAGRDALKPVQALGNLLGAVKEGSGKFGGNLLGIKPGESTAGDTVVNAFKAVPDVAMLLLGGGGAKALSGTAESAAARAVTGAEAGQPAYMASRASRAEAAQQAAQQAEAMYATRDATRQAATDAGYKFADDGLLGKATDLGMISRVKAEKIRSTQNELNATQRLAGDAGLPPGTALSEATIEQLKERPGAVYEGMKEALGPELNVTNGIRDSLRQTLNNINQSVDVNPSLSLPKRIVKGFLDRVAPADSAAYERPFRVMPVTRLSTDWVMGQISDLRQAAKSDFIRNATTAGAQEAGTARLGIANQLENLIEENLAQRGPQLVDQFRAARKDFAKIYLLERVYNPTTGMVDLPKLARISQSKQYRGVLTGEFKTAADFANAFGAVARKGAGESMPALSPFDAMFAVGSLAAGHPMAAMTRVVPGLAASMLVK